MLGKRVLCSESDPKCKDEKACTRDDKKMSVYAQLYRGGPRVKPGRVSLLGEERMIAPKDVKVHSSEIGRAIGLSRVDFWLDLISKPPRSTRFLPFPIYKRLAKAVERYKRLIPQGAAMKPMILESVSADPMEDLVYKIEDAKIILLVKCPVLEKPYEKVPFHYLLQAQALIALTAGAYRVVHLYCWTEGGSSLFLISPNDVLLRQASLAVSDFWEDHVEPGRKRYKSGMDPLVELVDLVPSDRPRNLEDILESFTPAESLLYEVSSIYLWLCARSEEKHFPNQLVDRKSYHMFEAPIARKFKRGEMNISDILYLGATMYDHQHKNIPLFLDDTLLSYVLHCETVRLEDERLKGARFWSSRPAGRLFTEAVYHALLRELVKGSQNPDFSYLLRSLKVEAAAGIKSGDLSADMFLLWAKTLIQKYVPFSPFVLLLGGV